MSWVREHMVVAVTIGAVVLCVLLFAGLALPSILAGAKVSGSLQMAQRQLAEYSGPAWPFGPPMPETVERVEELAAETKKGYEEALGDLGLDEMPEVPEGEDARQYWVVELPKAQAELESLYPAGFDFSYDRTLGFGETKLPETAEVPKLLSQLRIRREIVGMAQASRARSVEAFDQIVARNRYSPDETAPVDDGLFERVDVNFTLACSVDALTNFLHALQSAPRYYAVRGLEVVSVTQKIERIATRRGSDRVREEAADLTPEYDHYLLASFLVSSYFAKPQLEEIPLSASATPGFDPAGQNPYGAY